MLYEPILRLQARDDRTVAKLIAVSPSLSPVTVRLRHQLTPAPVPQRTRDLAVEIEVNHRRRIKRQDLTNDQTSDDRYPQRPSEL